MVSVAHGAGELHPLAFTGGQRGAGPIQAEVAQAEFDQPLRHLERTVAMIAVAIASHVSWQRARGCWQPTAMTSSRVFAVASARFDPGDAGGPGLRRSAGCRWHAGHGRGVMNLLTRLRPPSLAALSSASCTASRALR